MDLKQLQDDLFERQLSRKQFLQVIGATILSVIGFTSFIKNLAKFTQNNRTSQQESGFNYGETTYGQ